MARIRNVKPEFFEHVELQELEAANPGKYPMFVYAGLWTQSSKNGVFLWQPKILKLHILPFLDFDMDDTLRILYEAGYVSHFEAGGKRYGYIPTFSVHQSISGQETKQASKYPDYVEGSDWEVTGQSLGSEREERGKADLGLRTQEVGQMTRDEGGAREGKTLVSRKPTPGDIFADIQAGFLKHHGGKFADPLAQATAIRTLIDYTSGNLADLEIMLAEFWTLTQGTDDFWSRQPFLPSVLAKPGIWEQVRVQAKRKLETPADPWEEFAAEDRAKSEATA